jgi:lipid-A-disaccharide synthase-like uncharacterized protein
MMQRADTQARNQRLAWILVGTFALLFFGALFYIDWFHTIGPGAAVTRAK